MHKIFITYLVLFGYIFCFGQNKDQVAVIFDADMGPDYDDAGALAVLHALTDSGYATILATIASNRQPEKAQIFDVINTYFGRPDIPVGVPKGIAVERSDSRGWGQMMVRRYSHDVGLSDVVPDAMDVYRQILSQQPDNSVTIISVGFFTNLAKLLLTQPDQYSELSGMELVSTKVNKLVSMAGKFPVGTEHNVKMDVPSANYVFQYWPTEIIFSGFEIGVDIKTGVPLIRNENIQNNPIKDAYQMCIPQSKNDQNGRSSWDQTAVLAGVLGTKQLYSVVPGRITLNSDGANSWDFSGKGHYYLVENKNSEYITNLINRLMQHKPMHH